MLIVKRLILKLLERTCRSGTWTPHLYDYTTYRMAGPTSYYYKIGPIVIATIFMDWLTTDYGTLTLSSMLIIKNFPFNCWCWGGNIFVRGSINQTVVNIQATTNQAYIRPNVTGSMTKANNGHISGFFILTV